MSNEEKSKMLQEIVEKIQSYRKKNEEEKISAHKEQELLMKSTNFQGENTEGD